MSDKNKKNESRAFWIGIGTIVASLCIVIGIGSLVFSSSEVLEGDKETSNNEPSQESTQPQTEQEETSSEEDSDEEENESSVAEEEEPEATSGQTYEIEPGDTLFEIGLEFDVDWRDILEANDLEEGATLIPGDELIIPNQ